MSAFRDFVARVRRAVRAFESDRTESGSKRTFQIVVEPDELDGGWVAECIDLPGAMSQGETEREAVESLAAVIVDIIQYRMDAQLSAVPPKQEGGESRRRFALTV